MIAGNLSFAHVVQCWGMVARVVDIGLAVRRKTVAVQPATRTEHMLVADWTGNRSHAVSVICRKGPQERNCQCNSFR